MLKEKIAYSLIHTPPKTTWSLLNIYLIRRWVNLWLAVATKILFSWKKKSIADSSMLEDYNLPEFRFLLNKDRRFERNRGSFEPEHFEVVRPLRLLFVS